ncbi:hypothetical protein CEXT_803121 [Caerostris extrusa]|uniref:Uncharacterized protein n=1 Tax=Caerostris extrusa TaxID=172846 RepID=A0AAV4YEB5_CAEEX|nr:hypothetical protein CEXT_803121 [Caerostris extrusa]
MFSDNTRQHSLTRCLQGSLQTKPTRKNILNKILRTEEQEVAIHGLKEILMTAVSPYALIPRERSSMSEDEVSFEKEQGSSRVPKRYPRCKSTQKRRGRNLAQRRLDRDRISIRPLCRFGFGKATIV